MGWSLNLGKILGIRIRAHWMFLVMLGWAFLFWGGLAAVAYFCCLFGLVVLHELGHSLVARRYGIRVRDITLLPIGGMARLEGMPPTPKAEFWIALAGPMVNIVLAAVLVPVAVAVTAWAAALNSAVLEWLGSGLVMLCAINVVLAVFNLLPGFPMDGGRILRAYWARRRGMVEATRKAARVGRWVAVIMAIVGVLTLHFVLVLIALFVYVAGKQEEFAVRLRYAQAPTIEFDPRYGWQRAAPGRGTPDASRAADPRAVEEALRRMKERLRSQE